MTIPLPNGSMEKQSNTTDVKYLSVNELAEAFGLKPRRVYWLIARGIFKAERMGGRLRIRIDRLRADIEEARATAGHCKGAEPMGEARE